MPFTLSALPRVPSASCHWLPCTPNSPIFFNHASFFWSMDMERNTTSLFSNSFSSFCRCGTSRQHGTHHDAHRSIYTYLPRNYAKSITLPSASHNLTSLGNALPFTVERFAINVFTNFPSKPCFSVTFCNSASPSSYLFS